MIGILLAMLAVGVELAKSSTKANGDRHPKAKNTREVIRKAFFVSLYTGQKPRSIKLLGAAH